MGKTKVTMIRHGETEWNVAMRLQGMQDSPLTRKGMQQAELTARALQGKSFDKLITSDLQRAIHTAEIINSFHGLQMKTDPALRERNFGIMEGLTREEILEKYPGTFEAYMKRKDTYPIPEGESLVNFYARVTHGINKIVETHAEINLLIVTHGGVMDCMMRMLFDYPLHAPRRFSIFNAAINEFTYEPGHWHLETWGNIEHQQGNSISLEEPE